ncbi:MAG: hypothetical protein U0525_02200 [Patescibacteria group bacterium]
MSENGFDALDQVHAHYINKVVTDGSVTPEAASKTTKFDLDNALLNRLQLRPSHVRYDPDTDTLKIVEISDIDKLIAAIKVHDISDEEKILIENYRKYVVSKSRLLLSNLQEIAKNEHKRIPIGLLLFGSQINPHLVPRNSQIQEENRSDLDMYIVYSLSSKKTSPLPRKTIEKTWSSLGDHNNDLPPLSDMIFNCTGEALYENITSVETMQDGEVPNWAWFPDGCVYIGEVQDPKTGMPISEKQVNEKLNIYLSLDELESKKINELKRVRSLLTDPEDPANR